MNNDAPVEYTPLENRVYTDKADSVKPDSAKYVKMVALDTGNDIYTPAKKQSYVYRYGPTLIRNADGSIDAFFSSPGIFDESIISVNGDEITPKSKCETYVTAYWQDFSVTFLVKIK